MGKYPAAQVFTAGDNAYARMVPKAFDASCYEQTWGAFKDRTAPAPGNHEYYRERDAASYFDYFPYYKVHPEAKRGYYAFDLGGWRIVSLNSDPHGPSYEEQETWLKGDLKATKQSCILAIWHHPLFGSGDEHGGDETDPGRRTDIFWKVLESHHADVIINGHDHNYERFLPQDSSRNRSETGPLQFVVGTGGGNMNGRGLLSPLEKNSDAQLIGIPGILALTLRPNSYSWAFVGPGNTIHDSGSADCYDKKPAGGPGGGG